MVQYQLSKERFLYASFSLKVGAILKPAPFIVSFGVIQADTPILNEAYPILSRDTRVFEVVC